MIIDVIIYVWDYFFDFVNVFVQIGLNLLFVIEMVLDICVYKVFGVGDCWVMGWLIYFVILV